MFEPHRSNLNVEMIANKCGSGELTNASSQLNVARLLYTYIILYIYTFIITLSLFRQLKNVASRVFKGHFTSETGPRWKILPGCRKCLDFSLHCTPANSTSKHCMQPGGRGGGGSHSAYWRVYLRKHQQGTRDPYITSLLGRRFRTQSGSAKLC